MLPGMMAKANQVMVVVIDTKENKKSMTLFSGPTRQLRTNLAFRAKNDHNEKVVPLGEEI